MSLKPQPDRATINSPPGPTWGVLAEAGEVVATIRFACPNMSYSYPYHVLTKWTLSQGTRDELTIHAGPDTITITGTSLEAIYDALDSARVRVVRRQSTRYAEAAADPNIDSITVEAQRLAIRSID